jgi:hypothetical protein
VPQRLPLVQTKELVGFEATKPTLCLAEDADIGTSPTTATAVGAATALSTVTATLTLTAPTADAVEGPIATSCGQPQQHQRVRFIRGRFPPASVATLDGGGGGSKGAAAGHSARTDAEPPDENSNFELALQ